MLDKIFLAVLWANIKFAPLLLLFCIGHRLIRHRVKASTFYVSFKILLIAFVGTMVFQFTGPVWQLPVSIPVSNVTQQAIDIAGTVRDAIDGDELVDIEDTVTVVAPASARVSVTSVLSVLWCVGFLVCLVRMGLKYFMVQSHIRRWGKQASPETTVATGNIRNLDIVQCEGFSSPTLVGIVHPKIILPATTYSVTALNAILSHETTHFLRHDNGYKILLSIVHALSFFNPTIYMLIASFSLSCEMSCDEAVVQNSFGKDSVTYGKILIDSMDNVASGYLRHDLFSSMGGYYNMKLRIKNLANLYKQRRSIFIIVATCCIMIVTIGAIGYRDIVAADVPPTHDEDSQQVVKLEVVPPDAPEAAHIEAIVEPPPFPMTDGAAAYIARVQGQEKLNYRGEGNRMGFVHDEDVIYEGPPIKFAAPVKRAVLVKNMRRQIKDTGKDIYYGLSFYTKEEEDVLSLYAGQVIDAVPSMRDLPAYKDEMMQMGSHILVYIGDGLFVRYSFLSEVAVETGDIIEAGQVIGKTGSSGNAHGGPQCEIGILKDGTMVNPADFFDVFIDIEGVF